MYRILAIDDDQHFLDSVVSLLKYKHYSADTLTNPTMAIDKIAGQDYSCILLDLILEEILIQ